MSQQPHPRRIISLFLLCFLLPAIACGGGDIDIPDEPIDSGGGEAAPTEAPLDEPAALQPSSYVVADCPFDIPDSYDIECGYLTVPENRSDPNSASIDLAVAIVYGENPAPDPVVYLAGGPGSSAIDEFIGAPESWDINTFLYGRDLILIDQRGTGYSYPTLNCWEMEEVDYENTTSNDPDYDAAVACHDRLADDGVDFTAYNSAESAADIADLRVALGYDSWNVFGISYGTRLALTLMRDHPEGIRSVVIDSVYPPNVEAAAEEAGTIYAAMQTVFEGCAADAECDAAYPNLEAVLADTVLRLNDQPADAELSDPDTGDLYVTTVTGDDIMNSLSGSLYIAESIPYLPRMIYETSEDIFDTYDYLAAGSGAARSGAARGRQADEDYSDSEGMNYSVECREEYAFTDYDSARAYAESEVPDPFVDSLFSGPAANFDVCDFWGAGIADAVEEQAVVSDLPTLVLAGEYDPITPVRWAELAASTLSNSTLVVIPATGHSVTGSDVCANSIVDQFIADPTLVPDTSCVDPSIVPYWVLPGDPLE